MADKQMCVYKITNTENGKFYIGSTNDFTRRKKEHLRKFKAGKHYNPHLQKSFNKYGIDCFEFEIIFKLHEYLSTCLQTVEQRLIDELNPDYNIQLVVKNGGGGCEITAETRALISANSKLMWQRPEIKAKFREARLGKSLPEETKLKISQALKNNTNNLNGRAKHWLVTYPDGKKEEVYNLSKFCRDNGMRDRALNCVVIGRCKQYKGYKVEKIKG